MAENYDGSLNVLTAKLWGAREVNCVYDVVRTEFITNLNA